MQHDWRLTWLSNGAHWYCARPGCFAVTGTPGAATACKGLIAEANPDPVRTGEAR